MSIVRQEGLFSMHILFDLEPPQRYDEKYTRPKECVDCPLANDSLCQKVYKIRMETNLRRYSAPARGSIAWKELF